MDSSTTVKRGTSKKNIASLVISAMMLALCLVMKFVTELIPFFNLPYGGSISLILIPLVLTALYCGPIWGGFVGVAYGLINFLIDGVVSWTPNSLAVALTFFLDYFIAFGVAFVAGFFRKAFFEKKIWVAPACITLVGVLRLISHFFSGVIVWTTAFNNNNEGPLVPDFSIGAVSYSLTYNLSYILPSIILSVIVIFLILNALYATFKMPVVVALIPESVKNEEKQPSKLPAFNVLAPYYLILVLAISILSCIPQLKVCGLGYFTLVASLGFIAYEIYSLVKVLKSEHTMKDLLPIIISISLAVVVLALSILGICSMYTYGSSFYAKAE